MSMPNHFDRSKPFYPLVMNYVIQLIGFKELTLRSLTGTPEVEDLLQSMLRRFHLEGEQGVSAEAAVAKLRPRGNRRWRTPSQARMVNRSSKGR